MRRLFRRLMLEEAREGRFLLTAEPRDDERIGAALDYINRNFTGEIAVADIAEHIRLGEAQFRKLFRRELGITPGAYLQRARLIHAARLLARYDLTLAEVAEQSGFSNECYFTTAFRKNFDRTPGQYRRYIRRR
ncbi:putative response regulatory protein [bioreactor metagenome]|uniref:Putative response regulatory protein n=1 Tax=bioreactor metagenome TaxID=1076179 RepID=A0A645IXI9_9ZZZZ